MENKKAGFKPACETCRFRSRSLFAALGEADLAGMQSRKSLRRFRRRDSIFAQGADPKGLFCVASGQVKVYQTGDDGRDQIVRLAGPGDPLGYRSLLSDEAYSASAEALESSEICFIERSAILELLKDRPLFLRRLLAWLCRDLRRAEERLRQFAHKPARERLAETLVLLGQSFGRQVRGGIRIEVRLTREEIAGLAGMVLETAVRCIAGLKRENLIRAEGRALILPDLRALARAARIEETDFWGKNPPIMT